MADFKIDAFKKSVTNAFDRWQSKVEPVVEKIAKLSKPLQDLQNIKAPTDEEKKKLIQIRAAIAELTKQIEKLHMNLKTDLMLIPPPPTGKAEDKDISQLPKFFAEIAKKKGILIAGIVVAPELSINFKNFKVEKAGAKITFPFNFP